MSVFSTEEVDRIRKSIAAGYPAVREVNHELQELRRALSRLSPSTVAALSGQVPRYMLPAVKALGEATPADLTPVKHG